MIRILLLSVVAFGILISGDFCLGNEKKDHVCFRSIDSDKDEIVTLQEFAKIFGEDKAKFEEIDLNGDGTLSHDEYHEALGHGS